MKEVEGYEGLYSVTEDGKVFSHRRNRFMKPGPTSTKGRYRAVVLSKNGKLKFVSVHRLVAVAFIQNPGNKPQVNHIDGNPLNNHVSNLEWVTSKENIKHAFDIGLCKNHEGPSARAAKLTKETVEFIRANYISRDIIFGSVSLGRRFGVSHATILNVVKKQHYCNV